MIKEGGLSSSPSSFISLLPLLVYPNDLKYSLDLANQTTLSNLSKFSSLPTSLALNRYISLFLLIMSAFLITFISFKRSNSFQASTMHFFFFEFEVVAYVITSLKMKESSYCQASVYLTSLLMILFELGSSSLKQTQLTLDASLQSSDGLIPKISSSNSPNANRVLSIEGSWKPNTSAMVFLSCSEHLMFKDFSKY